MTTVSSTGGWLAFFLILICFTPLLISSDTDTLESAQRAILAKVRDLHAVIDDLAELSANQPVSDASIVEPPRHSHLPFSLPATCDPVSYAAVASRFFAHPAAENDLGGQFKGLMQSDNPCRERPRLFAVHFPWSGEWDLLDIHIGSLYEVVDRFFISEGDHTFHGQPRALVYERNMQRYGPVFWSDRVEYVPLHYSEELIAQGNTNQWAIERFTRQQLEAHVHAFDAQHDVEMLAYLGDTDQILRPELVWLLKWSRRLHLASQTNICLKHLHMIAWWTIPIDPWGYWCGAHSRLEILQAGPTIEVTGDASQFLDAGWHLQYFLGPIGNLVKIRSFSHAREPDFSPAQIREMMTIEKFANALRQGHDFLQRDPTWSQPLMQNMDLDDLPQMMIANKARFSYLIYPPD
jgi:hypothetical protein